MAKTWGGTDKSQTWLTFLSNHLEVSWAMDFFTVPTLGFQICTELCAVQFCTVLLEERYLTR
jgi:hypothetical protein